ncbi:hypothetical protein HYG81_16025 [Natrinema zhouii]|uniref:Uncharacterized protein n=1 Tax=Natrinema zhouii TaxID=1710539 RepID=A0A7D6CQF8_9EURY|nr:hypothetical protein [Natrinema zhouii]QLK25570.1 hypothetical protein HYG81_16025 [Natrinema zhouii]
MAGDNPAREPIVSEGPYAVVDSSSDDTETYRLVVLDDDATETESADGIPVDDATVDDLAAAVERLRGRLSDTNDSPESVELTCHECGKSWTYTGSDEYASCPNCEAAVPLEGIGP